MISLVDPSQGALKETQRIASFEEGWPSKTFGTFSRQKKFQKNVSSKKKYRSLQDFGHFSRQKEFQRNVRSLRNETYLFRIFGTFQKRRGFRRIASSNAGRIKLKIIKHKRETKRTTKPVTLKYKVTNISPNFNTLATIHIHYPRTSVTGKLRPSTNTIE